MNLHQLNRNQIESLGRDSFTYVIEDGKDVAYKQLDDFYIVLDGTERNYQHYIDNGYIDAPGTVWMSNNLTDGMTFVDVGASPGYYSLLASRLVGDSGHVISYAALESYPKNNKYAKAMRKSVKLNNMSNLTIRPTAAESWIDLPTSDVVRIANGIPYHYALGVLEAVQSDDLNTIVYFDFHPRKYNLSQQTRLRQAMHEYGTISMLTEIGSETAVSERFLDIMPRACVFIVRQDAY
jgi:23S rRNA U2552 (ribose-2'-O)-methylase RlmE/FtsJ